MDERADASASARSDSRRRRSIRNADSAASRSRRRDAIASSRRDSASVVARAAAFASDSARRAISRTRTSSRDWDSAASSADACSRTNSVSKATRGAHAARGSRDPDNTVTDDRIDDAAESSASSPSAFRTSSPSRSLSPSPPPQTGAKATVTAAETTAGPSALATQARTVPFRASVASPASAACTNPTPASRHIAAARATAVSDASPRFTKTPPTPPVGFEPTTVVVRARTFVAVAASTATPRWAAPSGRSARTKGANAATTAAPEESDSDSAPAPAARDPPGGEADRDRSSSCMARAAANASFARRWSPRRTAASPLAMSAAAEGAASEGPSIPIGERGEDAAAAASGLVTAACRASALGRGGSIVPSRSLTVNHATSTSWAARTRAAMASANARVLCETKNATRARRSRARGVAARDEEGANRERGVATRDVCVGSRRGKGTVREDTRERRRRRVPRRARSNEQRSRRAAIARGEGASRAPHRRGMPRGGPHQRLIV